MLKICFYYFTYIHVCLYEYVPHVCGWLKARRGCQISWSCSSRELWVLGTAPGPSSPLNHLSNLYHRCLWIDEKSIVTLTLFHRRLYFIATTIKCTWKNTACSVFPSKHIIQKEVLVQKSWAHGVGPSARYQLFLTHMGKTNSFAISITNPWGLIYALEWPCSSAVYDCAQSFWDTGMVASFLQLGLGTATQCYFSIGLTPFAEASQPQPL